MASFHQMKLPKAFKKHLSTIGAKGGQSKSPKKLAAIKLNLERAQIARRMILADKTLETIVKE